MLVAGFEAFACVEKFANAIEFIDLDVPCRETATPMGGGSSTMRKFY